MQKQRVIAIANEKGGTAKTTTAVSLSAALGSLNQKVLLVDLDGQAASSRWLGVEEDDRLAEALRRGGGLTPIPDVLPGLSLVPATGRLDSVAHELRPTQGGQLRKILAGLNGYDFIFIDCPPSLGNRLIANALLAANHVIVPVETSILALDGLKILLTTLEDIRDGFGHQLALGGVLACRYDGRTRLSQLVLEELQRALPGKVFRTVIRENVRMRECPASGQSILTFAPDSNAAKDYLALAEEILASPEMWEPPADGQAQRFAVDTLRERTVASVREAARKAARPAGDEPDATEPAGEAQEAPLTKTETPVGEMKAAPSPAAPSAPTAGPAAPASTCLPTAGRQAPAPMQRPPASGADDIMAELTRLTEAQKRLEAAEITDGGSAPADKPLAGAPPAAAEAPRPPAASPQLPAAAPQAAPTSLTGTCLPTAGRQGPAPGPSVAPSPAPAGQQAKPAGPAGGLDYRVDVSGPRQAAATPPRGLVGPPAASPAGPRPPQAPWQMPRVPPAGVTAGPCLPAVGRQVPDGQAGGPPKAAAAVTTVPSGTPKPPGAAAVGQAARLGSPQAARPISPQAAGPGSPQAAGPGSPQAAGPGSAQAPRPSSAQAPPSAQPAPSGLTGPAAMAARAVLPGAACLPLPTCVRQAGPAGRQAQRPAPLPSGGAPAPPSPAVPPAAARASGAVAAAPGGPVVAPGAPGSPAPRAGEARPQGTPVPAAQLSSPKSASSAPAPPPSAAAPTGPSPSPTSVADAGKYPALRAYLKKLEEESEQSEESKAAGGDKAPQDHGQDDKRPAGLRQFLRKVFDGR